MSRYFYSDPVYLLGEIDGTRIVSRETCEFLQKVPRAYPNLARLPGLMLGFRVVPGRVPSWVDLPRCDPLRGDGAF